MVWRFLTGASILDDVFDDLHMPSGAMVKIWLKSVEFKGIKNPPLRFMTFLEFLLVLMLILMFLTGSGVLGDVLDGLHMP